MSMATDAAIGMMDGAYFTSRRDILDFLNTLLDLNLTKIEQTASGAVACQLTEYLFPNSIPMSRVDWSAKSSHEYVANYKLLQSAFNKNKIRKHVDVDKLIRGKYQDNLEFCQWLKAFFDQTSGMMVGREGYDPVAVRARGKGGKGVERSKGCGMKSIARPAVGRTSTRAAAPAAKPRVAASASRVASSGRPTTSSSSRSSSASQSHKENIVNTSSAPSTKPRKTNDDHALKLLQEENHRLKAENVDLQSKNAESTAVFAEMEMNQQTLESERDFYFNKLRGIEIMLQIYKEKEEQEGVDLGEEAKKVIERAFKVMYATEEDNVDVDDDGNLVGDVTCEESVNINDSSRAQDELKDDEELVVDGVEDKAFTAVNEAPLNQFSDDSLGDEELLTAGLEDDVENADVSPLDPTPVADDDSIEDDNLLSD